MQTEETPEKFVPFIVGHRPFTAEETIEKIFKYLEDRISDIQVGMHLESLKGAANDAKLEAHRWATEFLIPDIKEGIRQLEMHSPITMIEDGILEIAGQRIPVRSLMGPEPEESDAVVPAADPNRLTPEFVGEPNERVMLDNIAQTVTPLENANATPTVAPKPVIPEFDHVPNSDDGE